MTTLTLTITQPVYLALRLPEEEREMCLLVELAVSLYQRNILSFGKARELAGMSKGAFHAELGKRKIERHYTREAFEEDLR